MSNTMLQTIERVEVNAALYNTLVKLIKNTFSVANNKLQVFVKPISEDNSNMHTYAYYLVYDNGSSITLAKLENQASLDSANAVLINMIKGFRVKHA